MENHSRKALMCRVILLEYVKLKMLFLRHVSYHRENSEKKKGLIIDYNITLHFRIIYFNLKRCRELKKVRNINKTKLF